MSDTAPSDMTYAGYLTLDTLLEAQHPISDQHDEMLFVIIHQTKELWLKQILHEVALAQSLVRAGDLVPAYKSLARVSRIQSVMTQSWDILATMTPADYLSFRGVLGGSSGFQSDQFRRFEAMLGLKDARFLRYHEGRPQAHAALKAALAALEARNAERLDLGRSLIETRLIEMAPEERAAFADRLEKHLRRGGKD